MGGILSREKSESKDFEKILSELDVNIRKAESRLSEIKIRQRRTSFMWIIYSLVIWIGCVIYLFYQLHQVEVSTEKLVYATLPVILLPGGIYYIRKALVWYYDTKQKKEEANLSQLRKEQKSKLEELKKKTSYYTTQSLLERYDEVLTKKKEDLAKQQQQKENELRQRKPVSMPMRSPQQQQRPFPPNTMPHQGGVMPQQQQQQFNQQQQPILPPTPVRSEPQWYDKIVDALVGDAGPETKYALICSHCFNHNGLVQKEEFDTIQYTCPNCKQFNPSRKSKQALIHEHTKEMGKENVENLNVVKEEEEEEVVEEEDSDLVLEKLRAELASETEKTIGARVRQRHIDQED